MKINTLFSLAMLCVALSANAQRPQFIRKSAFSAEGKKDVLAYQKAMAIMKMRSKSECLDPTGWYYQGAIHSLPDFSKSVDTLCPAYSYQKISPLGWNTCPHMKPATQQLNFLTWHRLYLLHLEKIVRKLSGKKDFALPYWNYNDKRTRTLPKEFREPSGYDRNSLFELRSPSMNKGLPINPKAIDEGMVITACGNVQNVAFESMGWALDTTHLWEAKKINFFSSELEDGVHNIIHDYVGGAVGKDLKTPIYNRIYQNDSVQAPMSDVPSSAFDPIFYLHHCNIDRLWASWEYSFPNLRMTKDEFSRQGLTQYIFFDENGKPVTYKSNNEVYDAIRNVDYTYDFLVNKTPNLMAVDKAKPRLFAAELVIGRVDTSIVIKSNTAISIPVKLSKIVNTKSSENATFSLEIDVAGSKPNHSKLVITLNSCKSGNFAKTPNTFVAGVVGFFGLGHDHGQDSKGKGMQHTDGMDMTATKKFTFDISSEIKQQLRRGFQFNIPIVGILPQNFDDSGTLTVKSVVIKEMMFLK
jgi:hypothetical protein